MKKTQILRKVLALVTVIVLLAAFSASAFAAEITTTVTQYTIGSTQATVTSNISGITTDQEISYVAFDTRVNPAPTQENIVFIDQVKSQNNGAPFTFVADLAKMGNMKIQFGSENLTDTSAINNTITVYGYTVTCGPGGSVTAPAAVGEAGKFLVSAAANSSNAATDNATANRLTITPDSDKIIDVVTLDGNDITNTFTLQQSGVYYYIFTGTGAPDHTYALDITFKKAPGSVDSKVDVIRSFTPDPTELVGTIAATDDSPKVAAFSTFTKGDDSVDGFEYGIIYSRLSAESISLSKAKFQTVDDSTLSNDDPSLVEGYAKYPAMASTLTGSAYKYAVQLIDKDDTGNGFLAGTYYLYPYFIVKSGSEYTSNFDLID